MWFSVLFALFVVFFFHQFYWRRRKLPPGPMPWSLVGNTFSIRPNELDEQLLEWKKQYGDVMTLWLPGPNVVFSDYELMKETFVKQGEAYAGRPEFNVMKDLIGGNYGLINNSDDFWRSQRRFALHVLRDFGLGKAVLETTVHAQAQALVTVYRTQNDVPFDMSQTLVTAVGNIVHQLTFGMTVELDDDSIFRIRNDIMEIAEMFGNPIGLLVELWIGLKALDPLFGGVYKKAETANRKFMDFCIDHIEKHRSTIDFDGEPRDYIDAFLIEQRKHKDAEGNLPDEWSDTQLVGSIGDLFSAGMETTSTTLRTLFLHLIRHPEVQEKIHAEIDREIGRDRQITMRDQTRLPYLNACLQELQRITTLLLMNAQHRLTTDVVVNGFELPKGTLTVAQFQSVHMDDDVFPNPNRFDPSRHLDAEGKFCKDDRITPFSIGKRSCLGESLARMELFLFSATLMQHFEFLPEVEGVMPELVYMPGILKSPKPYKTVARLRS